MEEERMFGSEIESSFCLLHGQAIEGPLLIASKKREKDLRSGTHKAQPGPGMAIVVPLK